VTEQPEFAVAHEVVVDLGASEYWRCFKIIHFSFYLTVKKIFVILITESQKNRN